LSFSTAVNCRRRAFGIPSDSCDTATSSIPVAGSGLTGGTLLQSGSGPSRQLMAILVFSTTKLDSGRDGSGAGGEPDARTANGCGTRLDP
jgi:hypothetical protein